MQLQVRRTIRVPARHGAGVTLAAGEHVRITDLEGSQPVDFWAFTTADPKEFLSCQHTKPSIEKLFPRVGDATYSNRRRPMLTLVADTSPGQHDMEFAACDPARYRELGCTEHHRSCAENLSLVLAELGLDPELAPQPWNLFTNFFINPDGTFTIKAPESKPGDHVVLRALMDLHVVVSACPQDMNLTCGGRPTDILLEIGDPD